MGGRRFGTGRSPMVRDAGGVDPQLPPAVSNRYLSPVEREDIALWRAQGAGVREIARRLGRAPPTISRELRRNASTRTYRLEYKASTAQWHAERRARRPKTVKLATHDGLRTMNRTARFAILVRLPRQAGYGTIAPRKNGPALAGCGELSTKTGIAVKSSPRTACSRTRSGCLSISPPQKPLAARQ